MNLIFDFDGTICDSVEANIEIINQFFTTFHYKLTTKEEFRNHQGFKGLVKSRQIPLFLIPFLLLYGRKKMAKYIPSLKAPTGLKDVLASLSKTNTLGVITSNSKKNVEIFLKVNNLLNTFTFIDSDLSLFDKHKKIVKNMSKYKLVPQETAYVGDETRDIEAARKSKITSVAVTWGHESKNSLMKSEPNYVIDDPQELLSLAAQEKF